MHSDAELLREYVESGSESAFAELVQRHVGLVYAAALRQLNGASHRAEDVTQSVFIDLARKAGHLSRRDDLAGWLYTGTRYAATALKRAEARREKREKEAHVMHNDQTEPALEWEHLRPVLDDAMHELSATDRSAVLMRYFQNLRLAEIGHRLDLSEDAARMRIERSLDKLRVRLMQRGLPSTCAALATVLGANTGSAAPAVLAAKITGGALAGAAVTSAGAGVLLTTWNIMTTTKSVVSVGAAVALLSLGTATYEHIRARQLESNLESAEQARDKLLAERDALRSTSAAQERRLEELRRNAVAARPAGPQAAPDFRAATAGSAAGARTPMDNAATVLMRSPEYVQLMSKIRTAKLGSTYAAFYRQMNLTPAQREEFEQLMTAQVDRGFDVASATWVQGFKPGDPAYAAAMQKHTVDTTARITDWIGSNLGAEGGTSLTEYNRTKPVREVVRSLAADNFDSATPLTPAQGEQLLQLLTKSSASYQKGGEANVADLDWDAILGQAGSFLSQEQFAALKRAHSETLITQQMRQLSQKLNQAASQQSR